MLLKFSNQETLEELLKKVCYFDGTLKKDYVLLRHWVKSGWRRKVVIYPSAIIIPKVDAKVEIRAPNVGQGEKASDQSFRTILSWRTLDA